MCPECRMGLPSLEALGDHLAGHDVGIAAIPAFTAPLARLVAEDAKLRWRFTIEGPLKGYRASIKAAFDPKYRAFKDRVQALALEAGFNAGLFDPQKVEIYLSVWAFWMKRPRLDWKNLYGAVEDSVWKRDRWIRPGPLNGFSTNNGRPSECAEVLVEVKRKPAERG